MPIYQPTEITVRLPHFDGVDITNDDRAQLVDPLLRAWAAAHYTLDYRPGEPLCDYMVSDFLADVMHWCDRVPVYTWEGVERIVDLAEHLETARMHHDEEVAEEVDQRLVCSECGRIGNQDDLCFDREACPDEGCGGTMSVYTNERTNDAPL